MLILSGKYRIDRSELHVETMVDMDFCMRIDDTDYFLRMVSVYERIFS